MREKLFKKAAALLRGSRKTVALSGAGISTPSGIPDFRSPGSGLWEKIDPIEVATIDSFMKRPEKFYQFMGPLAKIVAAAEPNPAHFALAEWESGGRLHCVVTQNIDNLHRKAGSKNVLELHGNGDRAFCMECRKQYTSGDIKEKLENSDVPRCDCERRGIIKPDVVLFGEQLPLKVLMQAQQDCEECDVLIVVGSSLTVAPASMLPRMARSYGAKLIVVNLQPTYVDSMADVVLRETVETALPRITEMI